MEGLDIMRNFWRDKRVLVTGHTGFKGSWLSLWLQSLGSAVIGYSLQPPTEPSLFYEASIAEKMVSVEGDILDYSGLYQCMEQYKPDIVIHMAAQSLVQHSYQFPVQTLQVNILGTTHVLEAARRLESVRVIVNVTSDKCYENQDWVWGYRENDPMGGYDPYSCSKGCAELVTASYRSSFFSKSDTIRLASARAGNVIGGGDWAVNRILPDMVRSFSQGETVVVRNPNAIRPWQHVLEPLSGYLLLAQRLWENGSVYAEGWNFGPDAGHALSVKDLVNISCGLWGKAAGWRQATEIGLHEAQCLKLDSSKAMQRLGWRPVLTIEDTLKMTIDWYRRYYAGENARDLVLEQLTAYQKRHEEIIYGGK